MNRRQTTHTHRERWDVSHCRLSQVQPLVQTGNLWGQLLKKASYDSRLAATQEFNKKHRYGTS